MSKSGKSRRALEKKKEKGAKKAQKRLLYASYAAQGRSKQSARHRRSTKAQKLICVFDHPRGPCGNVGCRRCSHDSAWTRQRAYTAAR